MSPVGGLTLAGVTLTCELRTRVGRVLVTGNFLLANPHFRYYGKSMTATTTPHAYRCLCWNCEDRKREIENKCVMVFFAFMLLSILFLTGFGMAAAMDAPPAPSSGSHE